MDTIKKIYEEWAQEKYEPESDANNDVPFTYKEVVEEQKKSYTAALEDRLEDVAVKFRQWDNPRRIVGTTEELFQYFINNIYGK